MTDFKTVTRKEVEEMISSGVKTVKIPVYQWKHRWVHDKEKDPSEPSGYRILPSCTCLNCGYHADEETPECPRCGLRFDE